MTAPVNLVGLGTSDIELALREVVDQPFRARQIAHWIVHRNCSEFALMHNVPKSLRETLAQRFEIDEPPPRQVLRSEDGSSKYLLELGDGATVEAVLMHEARKATLCLSSQTGCGVGCIFCVTGALGGGRNLSAAEIVGQYRRLIRDLEDDVERVNIVFMGMGEPLLNTRNLGRALEVLYERVSPKRITVSTAGIVPGLRWLAGLERPPKLAISLNAPSQEIRERLMPIAVRYPLPELLAELRAFPLEGGRRITFEYVLISELNDQDAHAKALVTVLHGIPAKINIIPLNEDPDRLPGLHRPAPERVDRFANLVRDRGLVATVRWSKGLDVAAACGQLKGQQGAAGRKARDS